MKRMVLSFFIAAVLVPAAFSADNLTDAIVGGKANVDVLLRSESVETDMADSNGLTLRSRLGYKTDSLSGFSAYAEIEDVRDVFGVDDEQGLIPDPEVTEVDQAFLHYRNDIASAKVGRQVIIHDGHRFIGHVGWRQDRQTFDAARIALTPVEGLKIDASYVYKRNRIFAETADADADDVFLNMSYSTPVGKLVAYSYLLDDETLDRQSDTYGFSFMGKTAFDSGAVHYAAEYATQESTQGGIEYQPAYLFLEGGLTLGAITGKLGYEVLGSDDGLASFTTPLSTLHKWNGWADVFVGPTFTPTVMPLGLVDTYLSLATKVGPFSLSAVYHTFQSDEGSVDYGDEVNLLATIKFGKIYNAGLKYASFASDGFTGAAGDIEKGWLWVGLSF